MLSVELGLKWRISESYSLYTSAYGDYSLNDVNKNKNQNQLIAYNTENSKDFGHNSILTSRKNEKATIDKLQTFSADIKVRFAFGKKGSKPQLV